MTRFSNIKPSRTVRWPHAMMREDGNILLVTGILMALLLFASLAYSALYYFNYQSEVDGVAKQVATYGATFLPDPEQAVSRAAEAFQVFSKDFKTGGSRFSIDPNGVSGGGEVNLRLFIRAMRMAGGNPVCRITQGPEDCFDDFEYKLIGDKWLVQDNGNGEKAGLPIESIKVRIDVIYNNFLKLNMVGLPNVGRVVVHSSASGRLTPTDVMLVVENSNSTVSQASRDDLVRNGAADYEALKVLMPSWNRFFGLHDSVDLISHPDAQPVPNGVTYNNGQLSAMTKADSVRRQCFGEVTKDIKNAALKLFDALSSSASFRVGVLHTMNYGGAVPDATIKLTEYSWLLNHIPRDGQWSPSVADITNDINAQDSVDKDQLLSNRSYLVTDNPETRCAFFTKHDFPIPAHPIFAQSPPIFGFGSNIPDNVQATAISTDPGLTRNILPRDLIWIANSGYNLESGEMNPKFDFAQTQFALTRAIDLLRNAPKRADNMPVRRRQVILLTDGFERPGIDFRPLGPLSDFTAHRAAGLGMNEEGFADATNAAGITNGMIPVLKNYCNDSASSEDRFSPGMNPVFNNTKIEAAPDKNSDGVRLSILYYNSRGERVNNDFFEPLMDLPGHSEDGGGTSVEDFKRQCNTAWSSSAGRTLLMVDPAVVGRRIVGSANGKSSPAIGSEYADDLTPAVIRSLMTSEVGDVK